MFFTQCCAVTVPDKSTTGTRVGPDGRKVRRAASNKETVEAKADDLPSFALRSILSGDTETPTVAAKQSNNAVRRRIGKSSTLVSPLSDSDDGSTRRLLHRRRPSRTSTNGARSPMRLLSPKSPLSPTSSIDIADRPSSNLVDLAWALDSRLGGVEPVQQSEKLVRLRRIFLKEMRRIGRARQRGNVALWNACFKGEPWQAQRATTPPNHADLQSQNARGWSCLGMAASSGSVPMVQWLLERDADVNHIDFDGCVPLHRAIERAAIDVAERLCGSNADLCALDGRGRTSLIIAAASGSARTVQWLAARLSEESLDAVDQNGWTALMHACQSRSLATVKAVLSIGRVNVNAEASSPCKSSSISALTIALRRKDASICQALLQKGARLSSTQVVSSTKADSEFLDGLTQQKSLNSREQTALAAVASLNLKRIQKVFVGDAIYCSINCRDEQGRTPIMILGAVADHSQSAVLAAIETLILSPDVNFHAEDNEGMTALGLAVEHGHLEAAVRLLSLKSDLHHVDNSGRTALMLAAASGSVKKVTWIQKLVDGHAYDIRDAQGRTALRHAVESQSVKVVKLVLASKAASIEVKDLDGVTPLMRAGCLGCVDIFQFLCKRGADLSAQDFKGQTVTQVIEDALLGLETRGKQVKRRGRIREILDYHAQNTPPALIERSFSRGGNPLVAGVQDAMHGVEQLAAATGMMTKRGLQKLRDAEQVAVDIALHPIDTAKQGLARAASGALELAHDPASALHRAGSKFALTAGFLASEASGVAAGMARRLGLKQQTQPAQQAEMVAETAAETVPWACHKCNQQNPKDCDQCWYCEALRPDETDLNFKSVGQRENKKQ
mmetsp:Transcript_59828/g.128948  ORF Transcript_59828/g.128948 Transcript_59828/m.128948 type:complete len:844 (-) Transcript_59828:854-3385(-)